MDGCGGWTTCGNRPEGNDGPAWKGRIRYVVLWLNVMNSISRAVLELSWEWPTVFSFFFPDHKFVKDPSRIH